MRNIEDDHLRRLGGKIPEHRLTFLEPTIEWAQGFKDSPEFMSVPEAEILAEIPDRDPAIDNRATAIREAKLAQGLDYDLHLNRYQTPQIRHMFRKMNYLRKLAAQGDENALRQAWQIRYDLAGNLFWVVVQVVRDLVKQYPSADDDRLYEFALNELLRKIDLFDYMQQSNPGSWISSQVFDQLKNIAFRRSSGDFPFTGLPEKKLQQIEVSSDPALIDFDKARDFLDKLLQKTREYRRRHSKPTNPLYIDALMRFLTEGIKLEKIADDMGMTKQAVDQGIRGAMSRIREVLRDDSDLLAMAHDLDIGIEDANDVILLIARVLDKTHSKFGRK